MSTPYPKEQMHRIAYTKLTPEQIAGKLAAENGPSSASTLSDALGGKTLHLVLDGGAALTYRFADRTRLSLTEGNAAAVQAGRTQRGYTVVIDQETNLVTPFDHVAFQPDR